MQNWTVLQPLLLGLFVWKKGTFQGAHVLQGDAVAVGELEYAQGCIQALEMTGDGDIGATGLAGVMAEIGDGYLGALIQTSGKELLLPVQQRQGVLAEKALGFGEPAGLRYHGVIAHQGRKGRKLRGPGGL